MSEIQLNKPLYDQSSKSSGGRTSTPAPTAIMPRAAKAPLWMRSAGLIVDLLLLHGLGRLAFLFLFEPIVLLGVVGPFVGLAVATLYFAFTASTYTQGRSIGKLVLRLQTCDVSTSGDLPFTRSLSRALLILWPLWLHAIIGLYVEVSADSRPVLSMYSFGLQHFVSGVVVAWFIGNGFFAWSDPYHRTWIDRLAGSVVISSDADSEEVQNFLRNVREQPLGGAPSRAYTSLLTSVAAIAVVFMSLAWFHVKSVREMDEKQRGMIEKLANDLKVPGFLTYTITGPERTGSDDKSTSGPSGTQYQYRRRTLLTADAVKAMPKTLTVIDHHTSWAASLAADKIKENLEKPEEKRLKVPDNVLLQVGFASYGDLFFAAEARNAYLESRVLDLKPIKLQAENTVSSASLVSDTATTGAN